LSDSVGFDNGADKAGIQSGDMIQADSGADFEVFVLGCVDNLEHGSHSIQVSELCSSVYALSSDIFNSLAGIKFNGFFFI